MTTDNTDIADMDAGEPVPHDLRTESDDVIGVAATDDMATIADAAGAEVTDGAPVSATPDSAKLTAQDEAAKHVFERKPNATQEYATSSDREKGSPDFIAIPPAGFDEIEANLNNQPNVDTTISKGQRRWIETLRDSISFIPPENMYVERLASPASNFKQQIVHNGVIMRGVAPTFKREAGLREVEGESALLQIVSHLGIGGLFRAPLWNSGIWVTFKPCTESELLELNRVIASDKITMGRLSYGLALSNTIVYTIDRVFDFALRHIYNTSARPDELPLSQLREWIAPQDIYTFIWGFLCANYPSGFHYATACVADPSKCTHIVEETLNVTKLLWVDESELTEWQKTHMSGMSANSKSLDSIRRYREELKASQNRRVVIAPNTKHEMAVTLRTPTINEYIDQGHRWIGSVVESINQALGMNASADERNMEINRRTKATALRRYTHWIDSIEYGQFSTAGADEPAVSIIRDRETIENTLSTLSATDSIREAIMEETAKYINESTLAIVGVPSYDCPACGKPHAPNSNYPRHVSIIPIDVLQVFFALLARRLGRVEDR